MVKTKEKSNSQNQTPKKKVSLGLLYHRLVHKSTRSLLSGDTESFWQYIELMLDPDPLSTSCQIPTVNKNPISKTHMKTITPFKWFYMDIMP